jgi:hypothetical protein
MTESLKPSTSTATVEVVSAATAPNPAENEFIGSVGRRKRINYMKNNPVLFSRKEINAEERRLQEELVKSKVITLRHKYKPFVFRPFNPASKTLTCMCNHMDRFAPRYHHHETFTYGNGERGFKCRKCGLVIFNTFEIEKLFRFEKYFFQLTFCTETNSFRTRLTQRNGCIYAVCNNSRNPNKPEVSKSSFIPGQRTNFKRCLCYAKLTPLLEGHMLPPIFYWKSHLLMHDPNEMKKQLNLLLELRDVRANYIEKTIVQRYDADKEREYKEIVMKTFEARAKESRNKSDSISSEASAVAAAAAAAANSVENDDEAIETSPSQASTVPLL